jgi:hypothetical protein
MGELASHYKKVSVVHLWQLFADDPKRGERMMVEDRSLPRLLGEPKRRLMDFRDGIGV